MFYSDVKALQTVPLATLLFFLRSSSGSFGSGFMSRGLFASLHIKSPLSINSLDIPSLNNNSM